MSEEGHDRAVELLHEDCTWIDGHPPPDGTYVGCLREFWDYSVQPRKELGAVVLTTTDVDRLVWSEDWERAWFRLAVTDGRIVDVRYDEERCESRDFEPGDETEVEVRDDWFERRYGDREEFDTKLDRIAEYRDRVTGDEDGGEAPDGGVIVDRLGESGDSSPPSEG